MKNLQPSTDNQSTRDQAVDWWIKLRDEAVDRETLELFSRWLDQDPKHREAFAETEQIFKAFVQEAAQLVPTKKQNPDKNYVRRRRGPSIWGRAALVAAACWLLAIMLWLPSSSSMFDRLVSDYHTDAGESRLVTLSDGSEMLLDSSSALRVHYSEHRRHIELLYGQARFSVKPDNQRPFEVSTDQLTVRALGTVFDVYFVDDRARVVVEQHAVNVASRDSQYSGTQVKVEEGQQLRHISGMPLASPEPADLIQAGAWQQHKMVVTNRPLAEVFAELGRYRSGRIFVTDPNVRQLRVSGSFSSDEPQQTVHKICAALNLQAVNLGPWVIVRR